MKKEKFYELLGDIDENAVKAAEKSPVKRKKFNWLKYSAAAAACVGIFIGAGLLYEHSKLPPSTGHIEMYENTDNMLLAAAVYYEMPQYPGEWKSDKEWEKSYDEWREAKKALWDQPEGYKDGFDSFFLNSARTFLTDAGADNKVYSPLSLYMALGMSAEISDGNTRRQILDLLDQKDINTLRSNSKSIWLANYMDDGMAKCILANSLWLNGNKRYAKNTINTLAENYYSSVYSGDPDSDEYNKLMQDWINDQTDGLLSDYVSDIKMDPEMVITLASTVNYSGKWVIDFSEESTKTDTFHSPTGNTQCDFMNAERYDNYFWGDKFSSVSMRLEDNGQMKLILPDEGISVDELLNDDEAVDFMMSAWEYENSKYVSVNLSVPKFDISSNIDLKDGLEKLGITDAFNSNKSDFSPLTGNDEKIALSKAEQDTRVMIDEKGCKAASLTVMAYCGSGIPEEKVDFILDRPFIFEIMSETGLPLFVGIVNNPT